MPLDTELDDFDYEEEHLDLESEISSYEGDEENDGEAPTERAPTPPAALQAWNPPTSPASPDSLSASLPAPLPDSVPASSFSAGTFSNALAVTPKARTKVVQTPASRAFGASQPVGKPLSHTTKLTIPFTKSGNLTTSQATVKAAVAKTSSTKPAVAPKAKTKSSGNVSARPVAAKKDAANLIQGRSITKMKFATKKAAKKAAAPAKKAAAPAKKAAAPAKKAAAPAKKAAAPAKMAAAPAKQAAPAKKAAKKK